MASNETSGKKKGTSALDAKVVPDTALAAVVGAEPLTRGELTKRLWAYIKEHDLQDSANRRNINADDKLRPVFDGRDQVTMFEMTKLVNGHVSKQ